MTDPFTYALTRIAEFGVFRFLLPWMFFTAVFYALLKKGKVFGESNLLNGTISLVLSFFIIYFSVASGIDIGPVFSRFVMQVGLFMMLFIFAAIGASILYPDLSAMLKERMTHRSFLFIFVVIILTAFITSGMLWVYIQGAYQAGGPSVQAERTKEIYTVSSGLIIMLVVLIIASWIVLYVKQRYGG